MEKQEKNPIDFISEISGVITWEETSSPVTFTADMKN